MIPLGVVASSRRRAVVTPPVAVRQAQEWDVSGTTSPATGPTTKAGSLLIARVVQRTMANQRPATITDDAGNIWRPVGTMAGGSYIGTVAGGSGDAYFWYCEGARPASSVQVLIDGVATSRWIFVVEWEGVAQSGALIAAKALPNASAVGTLPAAQVENTVPGGLVVGTLAATVSTRTFDLTQASKDAGYVAGKEHRAGSTTLIAASRIGAPVGIQGPQFVLSGTASTTAVITAAFRPAA